MTNNALIIINIYSSYWLNLFIDFFLGIPDVIIGVLCVDTHLLYRTSKIINKHFFL